MTKKVFVIGKLSDPNTKQNSFQLTEHIVRNDNFPSKIKRIHHGNGYTIYHGEDNTIWAHGDNKYHQCCIVETEEYIPSAKQITFTHPNNEPLRKICASLSGHCTFLIYDNNDVYGNGNNRKYQLGFKDKEREWWRSGYRYECEPKHISTLPNNLMDIKTTSNYSIALRYITKTEHLFWRH